MLIVWPILHESNADEKAAIVLLSAVCALQLIDECGTFQKPNVELSLHCGLSCGSLDCYILGKDDIYEFLVVGDCLKSMSKAEKQAAAGQANISIEGYVFIRDKIKCIRVDDSIFRLSPQVAMIDDSINQTSNKESDTGLLSFDEVESVGSDSKIGSFSSEVSNFDVIRRKSPTLAKQLSFSRRLSIGIVGGLQIAQALFFEDVLLPIEKVKLMLKKEIDLGMNTVKALLMGHKSKENKILKSTLLTYMKKFINQNVLNAVYTQTVSVLPENRVVSTMFIRFHIEERNSILNQLQKAFEEVVETIQVMGGSFRQFVVDDKGFICILCFGLSDSRAPNSALRSVDAAHYLQDKMSSLEIECNIGISSGAAYTGFVGNTDRRCEYTVMSKSVNLAARLMQESAASNNILVDQNVFELASCGYKFDKLEKIKMKGFEEAVSTYSPLAKCITADSCGYCDDISIPLEDIGFSPRMVEIGGYSQHGRHRELQFLVSCLSKAEIPLKSNADHGNAKTVEDWNMKTYASNDDDFDVSTEEFIRFTVIGESGIGKTHFLTAFCSLCEKHAALTNIETLYISAQMVTPGHTFVGTLLVALSMKCDDSKLRSVAERIFINLSENLLIEAESILYEALVSGISSAKNTSRLILILDDIDKIDQASSRIVSNLNETSQKNNRKPLQDTMNGMIIMSKSTAEKITASKITRIMSKRREKQLVLYVAPLETKFLFSIAREDLLDTFTFDEVVNLAVDDVLTYCCHKCKGVPSKAKTLSKRLEPFFFHNRKAEGVESQVDSLKVEDLSVLKVAAIIGDVFEINLLKHLLEELKLHKLVIALDIILQRLGDTGIIFKLGSKVYKVSSSKLVIAITNLMTKAQIERLHCLIAVYLQHELNLKDSRLHAGLQDIISWHFVRSDNVPRKLNHLSEFFSRSLSAGEIDVALILAKQLIRLATGRLLEQIWLKHRECLSKRKSRSSFFRRRGRVHDNDDIKYILISSKESPDDTIFECSGEIRKVGIDENSVLSWVTTCAVLYGRLGNIKKSEECFRLSVSIRIQLLRRSRTMAFFNNSVCLRATYFSKLPSLDVISSIVEMSRCHEEVAAALILRGKFNTVNDLLSSSVQTLRTCFSLNVQTEQEQQFVELYTRIRIMCIFANYYSNAPSSDINKYMHLIKTARISPSVSSPVLEAYDNIYNNLFLVGSTLLSSSMLANIDSQTNESVYTFKTSGDLFKWMACLCLSGWQSLLYAHNLNVTKKLLETLEKDASQANQKRIVIWVLQLRILFAIVSFSKSNVITSLCLMLEEVSISYVNESTFNRRNQCSTAPDVMSCTVLCAAYVHLGNWERAIDFAERVNQSIKLKKLHIATPFAGIMVILAIISMFSIIKDSKAQDTLRISELQESLDCLVRFAHHIADRYPALTGFLELLTLKHDLLMEKKNVNYCIAILDTKFPPLNTTDPRLLSYLTTLTKIEMLHASCQGHFLVDQEEIHTIQEYKLYLRNLFNLYLKS